MFTVEKLREYISSSPTLNKDDKQVLNGLVLQYSHNEIFDLINRVDEVKYKIYLLAFCVDLSLEKYRCEEYIARGSVSHVFKCRNLALDKLFSIKVIFNWEQDELFVNGLLSEARTLAKLDHKNIIQAFDCGRCEKFSYMIMEYVDGQNVINLLREKGRVSQDETVNIALQMADALNCAHRAGLIHQDVKPSNFLVGKDGIVRLCDMGLTKEVIQLKRRSSRIVGTLYYLSPEQINGNQVDERSDIYSFGASLYHMLVGRPPFLADSVTSLFRKHLQVDPVQLIVVDNKLNRRLCRLVEKCLQKDPRLRFQNFQKICNELSDIKQQLKDPFDIIPKDNK
ncbi:MAG: serine/threonine protein kinase [Planctomycetes bacterium]|nr:serine/threonine protein kinase [Planctomycetota bacterium]